MKSLQQMFFREPDGRKQAFTTLFLSSICLLMWGYIGIILDGSRLLLFIGIAFGVAGVAEMLPPNQRRSAGVLRLVAVSIMIIFLGLLVTTPELIGL